MSDPDPKGFELPVRLLGVPVRLDPSFALILPLLAWMIGSNLPAYAALLQEAGIEVDAAPLQRGATPWILGLIAALGLFASVLAHELAHALAARAYGVRVQEIRLWFLGGVAALDELPKRPGAEAVVAVVGPVASGLLALLFGLAVDALAGSGSAALLVVLSYLALTNGLLAGFNLLPALPLDGGRILRSLVALAAGPQRATRVAVLVSRVVALGLGLYGVLTFQIFPALIAFFIWNAGTAEARAALLDEAFRGRTAADLMTPDPIAVDEGMSVPQFRRLGEFRSHVLYPVVDADGRLLGGARMPDAREAADDASVADLRREVGTLAPDTPATEALRRLAEDPIGRLVVTDPAGRVLGILSRADAVRALRAAGEERRP